MVKKQFFSDLEKELQKVVDFIKKELADIRTGRANPKMVEGIKVNYYGTPTSLKDIANVTVPEARLIVITPWDQSVIKDISKAIIEANIGMSPVEDGKVIRLIVPPLSNETRREMVKLVGKIIEEGRISLRTLRRDFKEKIKSLEKEKKITEDDKFKMEDEMQKLIDKYLEVIENLGKEKDKELEQD